MKGEIKPNPAVLNKFRLEFAGLPPIYVRRAGPFPSTVETSDAPDRTRHSHGVRSVVEFTMETPMHHGDELAALEGWYAEVAAGSPTAKKTGTLHYLNAAGLPVKSKTLVGCLLHGQEIPEVDKESTDQGYVVWTATADDVIST